MRIVITGPPSSGKTTLSDTLNKIFGYTQLHTDATMHLDWSEASAEVARWFDLPGDWIIEGVVVPRAIRKWRSLHSSEEKPPFDRIIVIREAKTFLTPGQETMGKQVLGLVDTLRDWMEDRWIEL